MSNEVKSRTQKKKEDRALQKLGEELVSLSSDQLENIELPEELFEAVKAAWKIKSHGARRRQIQYIGVLMRSIDPDPIQSALKNIRFGDYEKAREFKKIEKWRDELKDGNDSIIEEVLSDCPIADRQRLTQLVRNARNQSNERKAVKASRTLFQYLKEVSGRM